MTHNKSIHVVSMGGNNFTNTLVPLPAKKYLFYQCLPDKTYHFTKEKCVSGKHSKVRLTEITTGNASSKILQMFVNCKSVTPRCFKGLKNIPCCYRAQKKCWMNSELFEEWVKKLDRKFGANGRKIALVIDNCPAHPEVSGLQWVELNALNDEDPFADLEVKENIVRELEADLEKMKGGLSNGGLWWIMVDYYRMTAEELVDVDLQTFVSGNFVDSSDEKSDDEESNNQRCIKH